MLAIRVNVPYRARGPPPLTALVVPTSIEKKKKEFTRIECDTTFDLRCTVGDHKCCPCMEKPVRGVTRLMITVVHCFFMCFFNRLY